MSLQLLRGRDLKPPLRALHDKPRDSRGTLPRKRPNSPASARSRARRLSASRSAPRRAISITLLPRNFRRRLERLHWQFVPHPFACGFVARLVLSEDERAAVGRHEGPLPVGITPYYASLMGRDDPAEPLRRTHIMTRDEYVRLPGEADDPLGEDHDTVVPGLVHRYPDRVLFLTTGTCSTYCRYCTRSRLVGNPGGEYQFSTRQWERALAYLEAHTEIRDVLLSGGDPLSIGDDKLDWLLGRLRAIKHIEFLRIGTKIPVVLPQRITKSLAKMLKKHHPLWMSIHFTHPRELTPKSRSRPRGLPMPAFRLAARRCFSKASTMMRQ